MINGAVTIKESRGPPGPVTRDSDYSLLGDKSRHEGVETESEGQRVVDSTTDQSADGNSILKVRFDWRDAWGAYRKRNSALEAAEIRLFGDRKTCFS
jgi:hypothetical protein